MPSQASNSDSKSAMPGVPKLKQPRAKFADVRDSAASKIRNDEDVRLLRKSRDLIDFQICIYEDTFGDD